MINTIMMLSIAIGIFSYGVYSLANRDGFALIDTGFYHLYTNETLNQINAHQIEELIKNDYSH